MNKPIGTQVFDPTHLAKIRRQAARQREDAQGLRRAQIKKQFECYAKRQEERGLAARQEAGLPHWNNMTKEEQFDEYKAYWQKAYRGERDLDRNESIGI